MLLVLLFSCAVILIMLAVYLAVTAGMFITQLFADEGFIRDLWDVERFLWVITITIMIVASGSMYRTYQLKQGGGAAVAEMLGGERVAAATDDPLLRRLQNVVEEMAIAAGLPVPPVYLLPQAGINAFAAGYGRSDAVIALTTGAIEMLNRDELQGVIAHEFSHVLNGDTTLKMRLMGLLFGITLISDAGIVMMTARHTSHRVRSERGTHPAIAVIGFFIFVAGTVGAVFADMIKRAVSRQREFLADAAAVQFTRNPEGIASALKVIGGYKAGSRVNHSASQQTSHFFFGNAVKSWENRNWWATHPPLVERIKRLDPSFSGSCATVNAAHRSRSVMQEAISSLAGDAPLLPTQKSVDAVMDSIGQPDAVVLQQGAKLLDKIPQHLRQFAHDPFTARAVVYALLLDQNRSIRNAQLKALEIKADAGVLAELFEIQAMVTVLDTRLRIPLLELLLPTLKSLSESQYKKFRHCSSILIKADSQLSIFEYMLHRMLITHLHPTFIAIKPPAVHFDAAAEVEDEVACIVSMLIKQGTHAEPDSVFTEAMSCYLGRESATRLTLKSCDMAALDHSLNKAARVTPAIKRELIKACVVAVLSDAQVSVDEFELLRAVCDTLDCPMPQIGYE